MADLHPALLDPSLLGRLHRVPPQGRVTGRDLFLLWLSDRICRNYNRKDLGWIRRLSIMRMRTVQHRNWGVRGEKFPFIREGRAMLRCPLVLNLRLRGNRPHLAIFPQSEAEVLRTGTSLPVNILLESSIAFRVQSHRCLQP